MRIAQPDRPGVLPELQGPSTGDSEHLQPVSWYADGEIMRAAYVEHAEDDDWGQPGTLVRGSWTMPARERLVSDIVGALLARVTEPCSNVPSATCGTWTRASASKVGTGVRARTTLVFW